MKNLNAEQVKKALTVHSHIKHPTMVDCSACAYIWSESCREVLATDALALINSQEQRIGAQDMTISELRNLLEKANHDADRYARKIKELAEEKNEVFEKVAENLTRLEEAHLKLEAENLKLTEENERLRVENAKYEAENHAQFDKWLKLEEATKRHHAELFEEAKIAVKEDTVQRYKLAIIEYYSKPTYQPTKEHPIKHTQIEHLFAVLDQIAKEMLEGGKDER